jgi:hypothetical protein
MATKKTKSNEKIKVRDFKMWLSGFLEFQTDDWVPNKLQWDLIKNKLNNLEETADNTQATNTISQPTWKIPEDRTTYASPSSLVQYDENPSIAPYPRDRPEPLDLTRLVSKVPKGGANPDGPYESDLI